MAPKRGEAYSRPKSKGKVWFVITTTTTTNENEKEEEEEKRVTAEELIAPLGSMQTCLPILFGPTFIGQVGTGANPFYLEFIKELVV